MQKRQGTSLHQPFQDSCFHRIQTKAAHLNRNPVSFVTFLSHSTELKRCIALLAHPRLFTDLGGFYLACAFFFLSLLALFLLFCPKSFSGIRSFFVVHVIGNEMNKSSLRFHNTLLSKDQCNLVKDHIMEVMVVLASVLAIVDGSKLENAVAVGARAGA
jgi:hypothetical protein